MAKKISRAKKFKTELDKRLAESLRDVREGRVSGPFKTAEEMIKHLHKQAKRYKNSR